MNLTIFYVSLDYFDLLFLRSAQPTEKPMALYTIKDDVFTFYGFKGIFEIRWKSTKNQVISTYLAARELPKTSENIQSAMDAFSNYYLKKMIPAKR